MPRHVNVPTEATQHLIRQAYEAGGKYQWAREAWKNSQESGATRIEFTVETQAAENLGVLRQVILDNGEGMEPEDMPAFLTSFGGGGKPIAPGENFGQGFKSSVLPWNPYGVVVISYTTEVPEGAMLWIHRNKSGDYVLKEYSVDAGDGDVLRADVVTPFDDEAHGCDWSRIRPDWMITGTIMVLLGDDPLADTADGDLEKDETSRGVVKYLNERLLESPRSTAGPIDTRVTHSEVVRARSRRDSQDRTLDLPDGTTIALHQRKVNGLRHFIPEQASSGSVVVDRHGTTVDWFHVPEPFDAVAGSAAYVSQKPVVTISYQGEAYHSDSGKSRYRQFGITDELRLRTWLIVRPPAYTDHAPTSWGVLPQASRNMLIPKGGGDLPWEEWGDAFYANFPDELADARDKARAQATGPTDGVVAKNLERILDQLNARFKAARVLSSNIGKVNGHPAGTVSPRAAASRGAGRSGHAAGRPIDTGTDGGGRKVVTPAHGGPTAGTPAVTRGGYPAYEWTPFDSDEAKHLARFDAKDNIHADDGTIYRGVVRLNVSHPVFIREIAYWAHEVWPKADDKQVENLVKEVYGEEAVAHVVHAQRLNGTRVGTDEENMPIIMGPADVGDLLTPAVMSGALLGLVNVQQRITTRGGGLFGRRAG